MAKLKGMCRNEDCEMCNQIQEAEKSNFKCEKCGKDLIPFGNKTSNSSGSKNKIIIGIVAGVVVALGIVGAVLLLGDNSEKTAPSQQKEAVVPVNSDSIKAAQLAIEKQRVQDSLQAVADSLAALVANPPQQPVETLVATPTPRRPAPSGSKNLGYATFKGSWPNDVNGRLIFKTSHQIDSRDPKSRMAEAGDYVIGEFSEGHLVQGIWYGADGVVKGSVIIGK